MSGRFDSFVIFAEMRTGSNFLEEVLASVEGVRCHGEAFNPHFVGSRNAQDMLGVDRAARDGDPDLLLAAMRDAGPGVFGFRYFHDHDPRVFDRAMRDRRCAKIVLTRNPAESYVSREIARQTGQWRLTDMKNVRSAQVRFEPEDFAAYLDAIQGFQLRLLRALQISGQTAFYIGYEDIGDLKVLNGLLRFLGVDARLDKVPGRLKKQNPEPLSQRVVNFDEMTAALADFDLLGLSRTPNFEPRRGPMVSRYVAAPETPLMYLPIRGGPEAQVRAWLAALDGVAEGALERGFTQKTLRQWKRRNPNHRLFTVVSHPLERAHRTFCTRILATGKGSYPAIRATLIRAYKVPLPDAMPDPDYDTAAHRAAFLGFLRFLKGNLGGQTALRVDGTWASQTSVLEGIAKVAMPDMVLRAERLASDLELITAPLGTAPPPLPASSNDPAPVPLSAIYDDEIEAAARDAYQRDYMAFGYRAWGG